MGVKFTSPLPKAGLISSILELAGRGNASSGWFKLSGWVGRGVNRPLH